MGKMQNDVSPCKKECKAMDWGVVSFASISEFLGDLQALSICSKQLLFYYNQHVLFPSGDSFFVCFEAKFFTDKPLSYIQALLRALMASHRGVNDLLPKECEHDKVFRSLSFRRIDTFGLPAKYDHLTPMIENTLDSLKPSLQQNSLCVRFINSTIGYGLFASRLILRGQPLCVYLGEIISKTEAQTRYDTSDEKGLNYVLVMREHSRETGFVLNSIFDATQFGNIARFANHSCAPNAEVILWRHSDCIFGIPLLVATETIFPNQEITFCYDYDEVESAPKKIKRESTRTAPCQCGSRNCWGFLPTAEI